MRLRTTGPVVPLGLREGPGSPGLSVRSVRFLMTDSQSGRICSPRQHSARIVVEGRGADQDLGHGRIRPSPGLRDCLESVEERVVPRMLPFLRDSAPDLFNRHQRCS